MIKNIIFDVDNTIIKYDEKNSLCYKEVLRNLGYEEENYWKVFQVIDEYEQILTEENNKYNKEDMLAFMNHQLHTDYPIELIEGINEVIGKEWIQPVMLPEETLQYLSQKYDCFAFSNWFEESQKERLKNIGYLPYFKQVLGADNYGSKPYASAYQNVLKEIQAKPEECIMIGDSKKSDVWGANQVGIKAILFDYDGKREDKTIQAKDYRKISNLKELEEIL